MKYLFLKLLEMIKSYLPEGVKHVYDPTCGDGALLSVFDDDVRKYGQELDPVQAKAAAERLPNSMIATGDTLKSPAFADRRFEAIAANPPFSIKWEPPEDPDSDPVFSGAPALPPPGKADYAFLLHILHCLSDTGTAVVLNFPGILYRGQREGILREWMIRENYVDKVVLIEGGHFVDTKTATVLLVLKKNRTEDYIFMRDNGLDIERNVPLKEIEANGFNLSVNNYIQPPEPERPPVDPRALEALAQQKALAKLRAEIGFSLMVAQFEGWSIEPFLDRIHDLINEFRQQPTLF